jgi:hypothetical protein
MRRRNDPGRRIRGNSLTTSYCSFLIRLLHLNKFFGAKKVSELKAQFCRDFVDWSTGSPNENNKAAGIPPRDGTVPFDQTL